MAAASTAPRCPVAAAVPCANRGHLLFLLLLPALLGSCCQAAPRPLLLSGLGTPGSVGGRPGKAGEVPKAAEARAHEAMGKMREAVREGMAAGRAEASAGTGGEVVSETSRTAAAQELATEQTRAIGEMQGLVHELLMSEDVDADLEEMVQIITRATTHTHR